MPQYQRLLSVRSVLGRVSKVPYCLVRTISRFTIQLQRRDYVPRGRIGGIFFPIYRRAILLHVSRSFDGTVTLSLILLGPVRAPNGHVRGHLFNVLHHRLQYVQIFTYHRYFHVTFLHAIFHARALIGLGLMNFYLARRRFSLVLVNFLHRRVLYGSRIENLANKYFPRSHARRTNTAMQARRHVQYRGSIAITLPLTNLRVQYDLVIVSIHIRGAKTTLSLYNTILYVRGFMVTHVLFRGLLLLLRPYSSNECRLFLYRILLLRHDRSVLICYIFHSSIIGNRRVNLSLPPGPNVNLLVRLREPNRPGPSRSISTLLSIRAVSNQYEISRYSQSIPNVPILSIDTTLSIPGFSFRLQRVTSSALPIVLGPVDCRRQLSINNFSRIFRDFRLIIIGSSHLTVLIVCHTVTRLRRLPYR